MKYLVTISQVLLSYLISAIFAIIVNGLIALFLGIYPNSPVGKITLIIFNWILWFVIINRLFALIKFKLKNKRITDWIQICLVSFILIINLAYSLFEWFTIQCESAEYKIISEEVSNSLKKIPITRIFYYYRGNKIPLWRSVDKCGKPFFHTGNKMDRITINNQLNLSFTNQIVHEEAVKILEKENLQIDKQYTDYDPEDNRFNLITTSKSKYNNAVQMSNYMVEHYRKEIKYAEPDMLHSLGIGNVFDVFQAVWLKTLYTLTTGHEPLSAPIPF